jgi:preprotein translocase subunit YajC
MPVPPVVALSSAGASNRPREYNPKVLLTVLACHVPADIPEPPFQTKDSPVFISNAFAQAAPAAPAAAESMFGSIGSMLPLILMFVVLYFVMIRPQMKRQKEHRAMIDALAKGDEVVIAGGILGRIAKMGDTYVHVEVAGGVEMQVQRASVLQVLPKGTFK